MYPKKFEELKECFMKLPGVGEKTAIRYTFKMLEKDEEFLKEFANSLYSLKNSVKYCKVCGSLTDSDVCDYCKDTTRDKSIIMVVTLVQDVEAVEKTGSYNGMYHVLNGNLNTNKGIMPEDLNIDLLLNRIDPSIKEIIIAISPTMEGEITALYLTKLLKNKNVKVTRLASGIPMGASLDYTDDLTLSKALAHRTDIE